MSKKILKNIDIIIVSGIGLVLLVGGLINVYNKVAVDYVSAATTANVAVTATVAQSEALTVAAVGSSQSINGASTTIATADGSNLPLGTISTAANTIAAHTLTMTTNASSGYTVYIKYDHKLRRTSSTTQDIDDLSGGATNDTPAAFSAPGTEAFGYTTEDFTLGTGTPARFSSDKWANFTTGDLEVAYHDASVNSTTTKIGYQAGISTDTVAGSDYGCQITYTMTSSF